MKIFEKYKLAEGEIRKTPFWRILQRVFTVIGILIAVNQIFSLQIFGFKPILAAFLYYECACFLPFVFINNPKNRRIMIHDVLLFVITVAVCVYLGVTALQATIAAWEYIAPPLPTAAAVVLWALVILGLTRCGGKALTIICTVLSLFPLVAGHMPGFLFGMQYDFLTLARMHTMSQVSIFGLPLQTFGNLLIGFTIFGACMQVSGCGDFFLDISVSLMKKAAGGPAKVACISSGLLGMVSGSVLTNVMTTGSMTIPAMMKSGYDPETAASIEACTSTGATLMPPIMGSAAFLIASNLGVPYAAVIGAAIIPAILYYLALFVQIDSYAMVHNIKADRDTENAAKPIRVVLKDGWFFIFAFVILTYLLVVLKYEGMAPYLTSVALLLLACINKKTRLNKQKLLKLLDDLGGTISNLLGMMAGVGLILGALSITGVALAFSRELIALVGGKPFLILIAGALTCFILGMGMSPSACYIFLAVVMAPALVSVGFNQMAVHLFILYWGMISYLSPPVALAVYGACGISKSKPWSTGWVACKLGIVIFFIPFFFVYNPALIGQGSFLTVALSAATGIFGTWLISSGIGGYIRLGGKENTIQRILTIIAGFLMCWPEHITDVIGVALAVAVILFVKATNKRVAA